MKASESLVKEQKAALSRTLEGFISCLAPPEGGSNPNPNSRSVIDAAAWNNRATWDRDDWNAWETWGWYRQFVREVSLCFVFFFLLLFSVLLFCSFCAAPFKLLISSPVFDASFTFIFGFVSLGHT